MNGKGSKPRPYDGAKFREGYDRIFRKRRPDLRKVAKLPPRTIKLEVAP